MACMISCLSNSYCLTEWMMYASFETLTFKSNQVVNLIPFNPIGSLSEFRSSSEEKVSRFQTILRGVHNIRTTVRKQMGQDISGACGQLVVNLPDNSSINGLTDIEDLHLR